MNLTNNSNEYDHEKTSSTDDEDDQNRQPSIHVEHFLSDNEEELNSSDDDDDDDNESDIENQSDSNHQLSTKTRLCSLLRQSNRLVELKLNLLHNQHASLRHALSESDMSKHSSHYQTNQQEHFLLLPSFSSNQFYLSTNQSHRLYLSSTSLYDIQTQINNWLQASTFLIDSISSTNYHRQCWSQLLLTYFIENGYINFEFLRCTHSLSLNTVNQDSIHKHGCVPEEDAYKLCSILQKGARFNINSTVFDHIRRIIVIKSIQKVSNDDQNLQEVYVKQLKSLKQSLIHQQSPVMNSNSIGSVASNYSKLLLLLSSLYSIKAETMQILFCQHLQHNPTYSYLVTS